MRRHDSFGEFILTRNRGYKIMGLVPNLLLKRPHVAEIDFTGIVVDANGTKFENGQAVWGFVPMGTCYEAAAQGATN